ncbi:MAG: D-lyxose/D-mannose family sugar isomerase [Catenisphaera adipataccumulans]|jgi:D-lyxose ketol-isomerase|uniref:D-lyxose/D-mannose family sugar isomerase n=1 Tax=Catenisphaera adipataccumulans TaxID=700500 RepID=UPI003D94D87E
MAEEKIIDGIDEDYKNRVKEIYKKSKIAFTPEELANIDYAGYGLDNVEEEGLNLIVYYNGDKYCAKEMALLPGQACPQHTHPDIEGREGKQETLRCRWGVVYVYYDDGTPLDESKIHTSVPSKNKQYYTAGHEVILHPGEQFTMMPRVAHWFKAGDDGAVISEFSTPSFDEFDTYENPAIKRIIRDR